MSDDVDLETDEPGGAMIPLGAFLPELDRVTREAAHETAARLVSSDRAPPHAVEAERALLGGLLLDPDAMERVADEGLRAEHFYRKQHGILFKAIAELHAAAEPVDTVTVVEHLMSKGLLDAVGGASAVSQLEALIPTAAHAGAYARMVREKAVLRCLVETSTATVRQCYEYGKTVREIVDEAEGGVMAVGEMLADSAPSQDMGTLVGNLTREMDAAYRQQGPTWGVKSGLTDLDAMTYGFQPGELIIVAARPSMGKTSFTLGITAHAALREKVPVAFFSLEQPARDLTRRLVASEARVNLQHLRNPKLLPDSAWHKVAKATGEVGEAPIFIEDRAGQTAGDIRARARRLKREHGIGLIVIDYLGLMRDTEKAETTAIGVGQRALSVRDTARELNVPAILLVQLNRGVEARTDKRPMMSDLRDSGNIEEHADVIMFLYREEYYLREKCPEDKKGVAEVIVAKQRNGPTGSREFRFDEPTTRFDNKAREDDYAGVTAGGGER